MSVSEVLQQAQFLVDAEGNRKAVVIDYKLWEELLTLFEDLEDAEEQRAGSFGPHEEALSLFMGNNFPSCLLGKAFSNRGQILVGHRLIVQGSLIKESA